MSSEPVACARLPRACGPGAAWPDQVPGLRSALFRLSHHLLNWMPRVTPGSGGALRGGQPGGSPLAMSLQRAAPAPVPYGPVGAASHPSWWR